MQTRVVYYSPFEVTSAMLALDGTGSDVLWAQVLLVLALAGALFLIWWPFVEAVRQRRVGWALAILLLAPLGGIAWLLLGRGEGRRTAV